MISGWLSGQHQTPFPFILLFCYAPSTHESAHWSCSGERDEAPEANGAPDSAAFGLRAVRSVRMGDAQKTVLRGSGVCARGVPEKGPEGSLECELGGLQKCSCLSKSPLFLLEACGGCATVLIQESQCHSTGTSTFTCTSHTKHQHQACVCHTHPRKVAGRTHQKLVPEGKDEAGTATMPPPLPAPARRQPEPGVAVPLSRAAAAGESGGV